ncbi:HIT domain-containing protein [Nocardioides perillae]|uniref:Histidine triad (HIT) family protein n=1 Tax=Nocardioides perillae TaxID=1119534 RepID=A0A7Y9RVR5_9ACTN|nr:histidine triad (HIT) family protein [Nocardioides perillae]
MTSTASDPDCLFCRIVAGTVPADVVHESATTVAFRDISPGAPTHVLLVPRDHHADAASLAAAEPARVAELVAAAGEVARQEGLERGYRLVWNTGPDAGQTVHHVHLHLLGGRGLGWPPG